MAFQNKDINYKIKTLNETLLKRFNNFILKKKKKSSTAHKIYWSILNRFLRNMKIPILPLILVDGKDV